MSLARSYFRRTGIIGRFYQMDMSVFDEYIVHGEPRQKEKADAWQTAIALQDVDGLKVSPYLLGSASTH